MKYARTLVLFCLFFLLPFNAFSAVELYKVSVGTIPSYVYYTLNCTANMTFEIFPSDSGGNITGPKIRTDTQSGVSKGPHTYYWPGTKDDGSPAPYGYYVCKLTASVSESSFRIIIGAYKWDENVTEYLSWIPPVGDGWGYYGVSINTNPDSPYYGRIYAPNTNLQDILMYDCDGTYLGVLDDSGIGWGGSAPWDLYVARDGYVYVSDRSVTRIYCFPPDGSHWVSYGTASYSDFCVRQMPDDVTHIYQSSGMKIYHTTVSPDHLTWSGPAEVADPPDSVGGLWVSADRSYMYVCQDSGTIAKWNKGSGETFTQDTGWSCPITSAQDVCATPDEDYLWIGRFVAASSGPIAKYPISGGSPIYYNGTPYVKGVQCDAVGNVLITYGKSASTWPSYYWCLATEPGTFTATRTTGPFVPAGGDFAPIVVPGSETWTYSDPSGQLIPDGTSTATVCFKVMDVNGCSDICSVTVDLASVKMASDPTPVQNVDSMVCQPDGMTVICCKTFTAVRGSKAGLHTLRVEPRDCHYPAVPPNPTDLDFYVQGATFNGTVKHIRHNALIAGATISVIGGMSGVYGYPFTYTGLTDSNGQASVSISEGSFTAIASKIGYKTQPPSPHTIGLGDIGGSIAMEFYLGPVTIAEAKALPSGTTASVEGVTFAWPKGLAPTATCGLDYRLYSVSGTTGGMYNQWYMCDRDNAANGMLFQLKPTDDAAGFPYTWDDPTKADDYGVSMYFGNRPALGNTICLTGEVNLIPGYEKRCRVKDEDFPPESGYDPQTYNQTYMNRGNLGGLPSPIPITIPQVYHDWNVVVAPASWGSFVSLAGARVIKYMPDAGAIPEGAYTPAPGEEHIPTAIVMDNSFNWTTITFQTPSSLCIADPPVDVGCVYTFTGAAGRRARNGVGTIRVRQASDIVTTCDPFPTDDNIRKVRGAPALGKELVGIVTGKWPTYVYVESSDRSSGVRVNASAAAQTFITVGDKVLFTGDTALVDGQKQVTLTSPFVILSSNNPLPYLVMRTMDIGGEDYGPYDPGITYGRGPLNVGLLVTLFGRVTARDTGSQWFYLWDGANLLGGITPLDDGTGNLGVRVISSFAVVPDTDFVKVTGVVSTNTTTVPGRVIPEILPTETPVKIAP